MKKPETRLIHPEKPTDPMYHAVVPPVYRATTYHHADPWNPPPFDYARSGNPTRQLLEDALAEAEMGVRGLAFSSGMSAITAVFLLFSQGDHLIVTRDCQGGTQRALRGVFSRLGISATYVDTDNLAAVQEALTPATKAIFVENFSNPFLRVTDIQAVASWAHRHQLLTIVDNTFITPYLQKPLQLGADAVVHSASKMLAGHSDVTAGVIVAGSPELAQRLYFVQNACGLALSPDDSYLVYRGLKTLALRMEQAQTSAMALAAALQQVPGVVEVYFPGLKEHPGHDTALRSVGGFGAMVTFRLESAELVRSMVSRLQFTAVGAGFGGAETSISLPELHCHAALTADERREREIGSDIVRVSLGLEHTDDIVDEFVAAIHPTR